jgi:hypothetical protein
MLTNYPVAEIAGILEQPPAFYVSLLRFVSFGKYFSSCRKNQRLERLET